MNASPASLESQALIDAATAAMVHAHAPVSDFRVGAALRTASGEIVTGTNVESPSVLQAFCAERVALVKALSEGHRRFTHIAVVAEKRSSITPCGLCRQMLHEFAPDIVVIHQEADGTLVHRPLAEYLPFAFDKP